MFSKKPTPDFSPRPRYVQATYTPPPTPVVEVALPEKIVISESAKLPVASPPLIITRQVEPPPVKKAVTFAAPPAPSLAKVAAPPNPLPASAFSPSLETFTGTGQSYFTLASDNTKGAQNWWKYPAAGQVDMSGNALVMNGGSITSALDIATNTIEARETANISTITCSEIDTKYISSVIGTISSFSTSAICLDGATLTTAGGTELLLNGIPLATTSNISSLADWSFDPAISTLNMNGNPIVGASDIVVSSINGGGLSSFSAAEWATYPAVRYVDMNSFGLVNVSTINGTVYPPPASGVTSLNGQTGNVALTSAGNTVTITTPIPGTINLEASGAGSAANWANYPAVSTVIVPNQNFNMSNTAGGLGSFNTAYINANVEIGALSNAPNRPTFNAYPDYFNVGSIVSPALGMTVTSLGGVNINSALGVSIAGGGGVAITGVGGINLQGGGAINVASGGILVSGGGIAVTAGGIAVNGGGLQVGAGGFAVTGGNVEIATSTTMGTQTANGGEFVMYGNNLRLLSTNTTASALLTDNIGSASYANTMRITGVSTINNVPFPPPIPGLATDLICSTLTAANYVSTPLVKTNQLSGTGVIIASETGHGITIGTGATEVNMTADVFIDAPQTLNAVNIANVSSISAGGNILHVNGGSVGVYMNSDLRLQAPHTLYAENIQECVTAGIDEVSVSSIVGIPSLSVGAFGTASSIMYVDQIAPRGGLPGSNAQFLTTFNNRIIWADTTTLNTAPTWSQYVATQAVNINGQALNGVDTASISSLTASTINGTSFDYISTATSANTSTITELLTESIAFSTIINPALLDLYHISSQVSTGTFYPRVATSNLFTSTINGTTFTTLLNTTNNTSTLASQNKAAISTMSTLVNNTSTIVGTAQYQTMGVSSLTASTINGLRFYSPTTAFFSTIQNKNLSTSVSTICVGNVTTNQPSTFLVAQASVSCSNATNQYHDLYLNLDINGSIGPSTITSVPAGIGHYNTTSLVSRALIGTASTVPVRIWASCDANSIATVTNLSLLTMANMG